MKLVLTGGGVKESPKKLADVVYAWSLMTHLVAAGGGEGVDNGRLCAAAAAGRLLHGRFHGERGGSGGGRRRFALCVAEHVLSLALEMEMDTCSWEEPDCAACYINSKCRRAFGWAETDSNALFAVPTSKMFSHSWQRSLCLSSFN